MTDQSNNIEKVSNPKELRLGWVIKETIGTCAIDPSAVKFLSEYSVKFLSEYSADFNLIGEDFEPYITDDEEEYIPFYT